MQKTLEGVKREQYYYNGRYLEKILKQPLPTSQLILYEKKK
jgi:hypothetical protein